MIIYLRGVSGHIKYSNKPHDVLVDVFRYILQTNKTHMTKKRRLRRTV